MTSMPTALLAPRNGPGPAGAPARTTARGSSLSRETTGAIPSGISGPYSAAAGTRGR